MQNCTAMNQFSEQLKVMIAAAGMNMQEAAAVIGIDKGNLSKIVNGKEGVTLERAERIANALGGTISVKITKLKKMSVA